MKRFLILILPIVVLSCSWLKAQNPFERFGYHVKVLTMSNGKYNEFFDLDTIQQVGDVLINTNTMKVIGFAEKDTVNPMPEPQLISRWISPDPLAEKYYFLSPYNYVSNNPMILIDPDGMKIRYSIWNGREFNNRMREHIEYMKEHGSQELRDRIIAMENDPKKVKIKASKTPGDFGFDKGTIYMSKDENDAKLGVYPGVNGEWVQGDEYSSLANELSHAEDYIKGEEPSSYTYLEWKNAVEVIPNFEVKSNEFENLARDAKNMPLRSISHLGMPSPSGITTPEMASDVLRILNTYCQYPTDVVSRTFSGMFQTQVKYSLKAQFDELGNGFYKIINKRIFDSSQKRKIGP